MAALLAAVRSAAIINFAGSGLVIGFRNMFDGTTNHKDRTFSFVTPTGTATATADFHRWFDALTGRIGYSWASPWLVYFQGGAVWSRVEADLTLATPAGVTVGSFSDTKTGWTVELGGEYRFSPQLVSLSGRQLLRLRHA